MNQQCVAKRSRASSRECKPSGASISMSRPVRSTASSARTGRASRQPCACCARCSRRRAGRHWLRVTTSVTQPGAVRLRIGVALQEAALDPRQTGRELLLLQARLYGLSRAGVRAARRRVGRTDRPQRCTRSAHRHVFRGHETAPRPRRVAHPRSTHLVSRRADHGSRPHQSYSSVERGPAPES